MKTHAKAELAGKAEYGSASVSALLLEVLYGHFMISDQNKILATLLPAEDFLPVIHRIVS